MRSKQACRLTPTVDLTGVDCCAYCRVSTERQAGEAQTSLADQRATIEALAAKLGVAVGAWFTDAGASGATAEGRPQFSALLSSCEASARSRGSPGLILVLNDSRFGRFEDPEEATYWRVHLSRLGWRVRFCEGDELESGMARGVMRFIGSAQASEYRQNIKRNARRGAEGTARQGYWRTKPPYGYCRKVVFPAGRERLLPPGVPKAPDEKIALWPVEDEAAIVRELFLRFAGGGESLGSLAGWLQHRAPGRAWSRMTVHAVLRNPVYCGDVIGGRRRSDGSEAGETYGKRDAHPPLVERSVFAQVQDRLAANRRQTRAVRSEYLLTGLVICSHCGHAYTGGGLGGDSRLKKLGDARPHFYKCSGGTARMKLCPGKIGTVSRHLLERAVLDTISREVARKAVRERIVAEVDRALAKKGAAPAKDVTRVLAALAKKRDRLVSAVADGTVTSAEVAAQLTMIRAQIADAEAIRDRARFAEQGARISPKERDDLLQFVFDFPALVKQAKGPALRELVQPWLASATFDKETRYLTLGIRRVPALHLFNVPARG